MKKIFISILTILFLLGCIIPNTSVNAATTDDGNFEYAYTKDGVIIVKYNGNSPSVEIPSMINEKPVTAIQQEAFRDNTGITSVIMPNTMKNIGSIAFYGCTGLKSVTMQNSVVSIGNNAFGECTGLQSVTIPNGVVSIGDSAFKGCTRLVSIELPDSLETIGTYAFGGCTSLESIIIPKGISILENNLFSNCTSLKEITIPSNITTINSHVFLNCSGLTSIIIPDSVITINDKMINDDSKCVIYCKQGSVAEAHAKSKNISYNNFYLSKVTLSTTSYICDGKEKRPSITVKYGSKTLTKGTDYTVEYNKNVGAGKATVTVAGAGVYVGTITKTFTITNASYYNLTINGGTWKNGIYTLGGVKMTDIFFSDGKYTYYLQADGTPMKNRLTYHPDGVHLIYFDDKGHELFDKFQYCADVGYTCYFDTFGYLYKDVLTFSNGKPYYLDGTGRMKQNEYFKFDNGVDLGYAQADGSLINTGFGNDSHGNTVFYHWNGMVARGLITDGVWYYDMDLTDGHLIGKFAAN